MAPVREAWTDERLDDFAARTEQRFDGLERRMEDGFNRVHAEFRDLRRDMDAKFERLDAKIDALQRLIIQVGGGMFATFAIGILGLVATQL